MTTSSIRLIAALPLFLLVPFFVTPALGEDTDPVEEAIAALDAQRYAEALERITPLADAGDARAQNILGALSFVSFSVISWQARKMELGR